MDIHLSHDLQEFVDEQVRKGHYAGRSEAIVTGLELLRQWHIAEEARLDALRKEVQKGVDSLEAGRSSPLTEQSIDDIKRHGRERLARLRRAAS